VADISTRLRRHVARALTNINETNLILMRKHLMSTCYLSRCLTLALLLTIVPRIASAQIVDIPDAGLRAAIRKTLHKPSGDLTVADMETLTVLCRPCLQEKLRPCEECGSLIRAAAY